MDTSKSDTKPSNYNPGYNFTRQPQQLTPVTPLFPYTLSTHGLGASNSNELTIRFARAVTFASARIISGAYSTSNAARTEPAILLAWRSDQNRKSSGSERFEEGVTAGLEVVSESEDEEELIPELRGTREGSESRQRVTILKRVRRTDSKSRVLGLSTTRVVFY